MEIILFESLRELRKNKAELESKLKVSIEIQGKKVTINGDAIDEYEAAIVLDAMHFGFSAKKALTLKDAGIIFVKVPIKAYTKRNDKRTIRARIIGREGKTKRTLEDLSDSDIKIKGNEVGIIGDAEAIEETRAALITLIRGSKEANVYRFLERMNAEKKKFK